METLTGDLSLAVRQWFRTPAVTAAALLSLALGIGANSALFSLVNALLLKPLPVHEPELLTQITGRGSFSTQVWQYVSEHQPVFSDVFAASGDRFNLARGGEARYASTLIVSGNFFDAIGVQVRLGRPIEPRDDRPGATPVAVVSDRFWRRELGGPADIFQKQVWLDGQPFDIVGVASPAFFGIEVGRGADVVVPMASLAAMPSRSAFLTQANARRLMLFGRLRQGQSADEARPQLRAWQPELADATRPAAPMPGLDPAAHLSEPLDVTGVPNGVSAVRAQYGRPLLLLFGAVAFVLLVACANLAALVLARFAERQHELSVRHALGASRRRLVQSMVVESLVLGVAGAALGLVFASWLTQVVVPHLTLPALRGLAPRLDVSLDREVVGMTAGLALAVSLLTGLLPAVATARHAGRSLTAGAPRGRTGQLGPLRTMRVLVVAQVAVSILLVACAVLLMRSFLLLTTQETGFDRDRVLVVTATGDFGSTRSEGLAVIDRVRARLNDLPGIEAVTASPMTPISGITADTELAVPGSAPAEAADRRIAINRVLPGYLTVFGTPLLRGRDLRDADNADTQQVAVVNESFADRYFGGRDPVGRTIVLGGRETAIVGMVRDAKQFTLREPPRPFVYASLRQWTFTRLVGLRFSLRAPRPDAIRGLVVQAFRGLDPRMTIELRTLSEDVNRSINAERLLAWCGAWFGALALLIGMMGLYGTLTYAVSRRRAEIGVRMAIGADRQSILGLVMRDACLVLGAGIVIGLAGALAAGQVIEAMLYGVSPLDPVTLVTATLSLLIVGMFASYLPAWHASRTDPMMTTLRED